MKRIVITKYNENIDWLNSLKDFDIIIYDKSPNGNLPNTGREAHSIAYYCYHHYNNLPNLNVFCQGNPFTHSDDFLTRLNIDWMEPTSLASYYKKDCPPDEIKQTDFIYQSNGFEIRLGLADYFGRNLNAPNGRNRQWCELVWGLVFSNPPPPPKIYFGYSALWAVPKETILNRKREFWGWLLKILEGPAGNSKQDNDPIYPLNAWALEILWHYIWQSPQIYKDYF